MKYVVKSRFTPTQDDQQRFRDYLQSPLGRKKLSEINREMIAKILAEAEADGKAGATLNKIKALASVLFAKAIEWSLLESNPATGIKGWKPVKRDRFLLKDELPRFFDALDAEPNETARDYILLALLTGARRENLCAMHWREINLNEGVWRIPRTKNGDPQTVHSARKQWRSWRLDGKRRPAVMSFPAAV